MGLSWCCRLFWNLRFWGHSRDGYGCASSCADSSDESKSSLRHLDGRAGDTRRVYKSGEEMRSRSQSSEPEIRSSAVRGRGTRMISVDSTSARELFGEALCLGSDSSATRAANEKDENEI